MSDQPEALQTPLPDLLDKVPNDLVLGIPDNNRVFPSHTNIPIGKLAQQAAAELRRQHDEIEQLKAERDALKTAAEKGTEYVLAHINQDLKAERDALLVEVERLKGVNYDSCAGEKEMTRDDIIRMAREAGFSQPWTAPKETQERLARFVSLIAAAERKTRALEKEPVAWVKHDGEIVVRIDYGGRLYYAEQNIYTADVVRKAIEAEREKVAAWMIRNGYATGHGDTIEDLLEEMEWQVREREREACARLCEKMETYGDPVQCWLDQCAAAIRARGET